MWLPEPVRMYLVNTFDWQTKKAHKEASAERLEAVRYWEGLYYNKKQENEHLTNIVKLFMNRGKDETPRQDS